MEDHYVDPSANPALVRDTVRAVVDRLDVSGSGSTASREARLVMFALGDETAPRPSDAFDQAHSRIKGSLPVGVLLAGSAIIGRDRYRLANVEVGGRLRKILDGRKPAT